DVDAALDRGVERLLDLDAIEPENDDVDRLPGFPDCLHDRLDAIVGLNDQLHFGFVFFSVHSTAAWPSGSSFRIASVPRSRRRSSGTCTAYDTSSSEADSSSNFRRCRR